MTSQGSAYGRLRRALDGSRSTAAIRDAAGELLQIGLEDALDICLALLEREPERYPRAAARWAARLALEHTLALGETQLAIAALAALEGEAARAGAETLIELSQRHGIARCENVLLAWMHRQGIAE
jgi:hypothetical protein